MICLQAVVDNKVIQTKIGTAKQEHAVIRDLPFTRIIPLGPLIPQETIDYFRDIFTDKLLMWIVDENDEYAFQVDITKPLNLTQSELKQFISKLLPMSIVKTPSSCDYWDQHFQYQNISNVMSARRFGKIKNFLHWNDNRSIPIDCTDKIRPVIDTSVEYFQLPAPIEYLDEQMVPFKGRSKLK